MTPSRCYNAALVCSVHLLLICSQFGAHTHTHRVYVRGVSVYNGDGLYLIGPGHMFITNF